MRIAFLAEAFGSPTDSLLDRVSHSLARMAQREGHWVQVIAAGRVGQAQAVASGTAEGMRPGLVEGISVLRLPYSMFDASSELFGQWLTEMKFDLAHAVVAASLGPLGPPMQRIVRNAIPLLVTLTELPSAGPGALDAADRALLASAGERLVPSAYAQGQWQRALPGCTLRVLAHGVDLLALAQAGSANRSDLAATRPPTLACVGRIDERSGVLELLQAFAAVNRPHLRLRLQGAVDSHSQHGRAIAELLAADRRVSIEIGTGLASLAPLAGQFDLACVPSLEAQAFSLPVHECAALGAMCLVSDLGAQAEAVRRYQCGQRLPPGDVAAWAQAIDQWAEGFDPKQPQRVDGRMPMRIEEEAFLCESLYRELLFRCRS